MAEQGGDLLEVVNRQGCLPEPVAYEIFQQIGDALEYAHELHIVHRDVKVMDAAFVAPVVGLPTTTFADQDAVGEYLSPRKRRSSAGRLGLRNGLHSRMLRSQRLCRIAILLRA